jgi:hypothetical protein
MTTQESAAACELARQLLDRETVGITNPDLLGAAMQQAWMRVSENLRQSVGDDGFHALSSRALARAEADQPLLRHMRRSDSAGVHLEVIAAAEVHGVVAVSAALESLLAALVDILSDLIGADMVRNLLNYDDARQELPARRAQ